jgi:hypothetical protein
MDGLNTLVISSLHTAITLDDLRQIVSKYDDDPQKYTDFLQNRDFPIATNDQAYEQGRNIVKAEDILNMGVLEEKSYTICEHCGSTQNVDTREIRGWIYTVCDKCAKELETKTWGELQDGQV